MNVKDLESLTKKLILHGPTEEVQDYAMEVLDLINDLNRVAEELMTDADEYSMRFAIRENFRIIETQKKTIVELRKRNGKL